MSIFIKGEEVVWQPSRASPLCMGVVLSAQHFSQGIGTVYAVHCEEHSRAYEVEAVQLSRACEYFKFNRGANVVAIARRVGATGKIQSRRLDAVDRPVYTILWDDNEVTSEVNEHHIALVTTIDNRAAAIEYDIVQTYGVKDLVDAVNAKLVDGWTLYGPAVLERDRCLQPVTRSKSNQ